MKKIVGVVVRCGVVVLLLLEPTLTAFAGGDDPPVPPVGPPSVQTSVGENGEVITIVSQESTIDGSSNGGIIPAGSSTVQVGSHTVKYSLCWAYFYNPSLLSYYTYHCYAKTEKISGTGTYKTHAHAALIKGSLAGVSYTDPVVFGYPPTACASITKTNATSTTCKSPNFASKTNQWWYAISGHWYDLGADGTINSRCDGCIDTKYRVP